VACEVGKGQRGIIGSGAEPEYIGLGKESGHLKGSRVRSGICDGGRAEIPCFQRVAIIGGSVTLGPQGFF